MPGYANPPINIAGTVAITPTGNISSLTLQDAITEIDTEKAPKASPTLTGTTTTANIISVAPNTSTVPIISKGAASHATDFFGVQNSSSANIFSINSSGHAVPGATNTYDLGTSSLRWRNIYTQDLHLSNGIGDYTVIEGEEDLFLINNKNGKSYKFGLIEVDSSEVPPKSEA